MALSESERRELDEMLTALCEGQLEDSQVEHLLQWLEEPEVQDRFVSHAMLNSELCMLYNGPKEISLPKEAASPAKTPGPRLPGQPHAPRRQFHVHALDAVGPGFGHRVFFRLCGYSRHPRSSQRAGSGRGARGAGRRKDEGGRKIEHCQLPSTACRTRQDGRRPG